MSYTEKNKELFDAERKLHDLRYPDEGVVRFLFKTKSLVLGNSVLDFACGSGRNTKVMVDLGYEVYAMDYNDSCLELTKKKVGEYERIHFMRNEALNIPLQSESMDCIVACGVLFCMSRMEEEELFSELIRVLKKGGVVYADFRGKEDFMYGEGEEIERDFYRLNDKCGDLAGLNYLFEDMSTIRELYQRNGIEIINHEKLNLYTEGQTVCNSHYNIWGRKL